VVKRMTYPAQLQSTSAGSVIAVTSFSTASVQAYPATEFASFSARYQQYRVKRITLDVFPLYPGSGDPQVAGAAGHSVMYVGDFIGSATPASATQVLSDEKVRLFGTYQRWKFSASWERNPNAKLWNPTSAIIPTANTFSVVYASAAASELPASAVIFVYVLTWDVEFRGSQ